VATINEVNIQLFSDQLKVRRWPSKLLNPRPQHPVCATCVHFIFHWPGNPAAVSQQDVLIKRQPRKNCWQNTPTKAAGAGAPRDLRFPEAACMQIFPDPDQ